MSPAVRAYGRAMLPHPAGDTPVVVARVRGWVAMSGRGPRPAHLALVFRLPCAPATPLALGPGFFGVEALRRAARDPRTSPRARVALNRWRRELRAGGER